MKNMRNRLVFDAGGKERQTEPEGKNYIKKYVGQVRLFNGASKVDEVMTLACILPSGAVPYVSKNRFLHY